MTDKLSDAQWDKIIACAVENARTALATPEDMDIFGEESSDFELEDGDYDADTDHNVNTEGEDDAVANVEKQNTYRWSYAYAGSDEEEVDQLEDD
jgi:hypothetical protein